MKTLVVYDSAYGNTAQIAESIGNALSGQTRVLHVKEAGTEDMENAERLIIGSPTHGGKATEAVTSLLNTISPSKLQDVKVAAFDTRLSSKLVGIFGYAAGKIMAVLSRKGGTRIAAPEGFIVKGRNGPLQAKELERAAEWARTLDGQNQAESKTTMTDTRENKEKSMTQQIGMVKGNAFQKMSSAAFIIGVIPIVISFLAMPAGLAWGETKAKATRVPVANSANEPVTLSAAVPASVGFDQGGLALLNGAMHRMVDEGEVAGVMTMLVRHGKIVNYDAYGKDSIVKGTPLRRDSIFRMFSQTKPLTGVAMMILYEQGKWQLNDPVSKYVPEFANLKVFTGLDKEGKPILEDAKQPPTMAMLMTHTAGFGYGLEYANYVDYVDQQFQKLGVLKSSSLHEAVTKIASIPLLYQPGTRWWYSAGVDIQGYIVEELSGQPFGDFLAEQLFEPLGMKDSGFYAEGDNAARLASVYQFDPKNKKLIELTPANTPGTKDFTKQPSMELGGGGDGGGGGGLVSTIDDYARFCQMILNGGTYNGVRILAPESVALMQADHIPDTVLPEANGGVQAIGGPALGYGLDFGVIKDPASIGMLAGPGSIYWAGGGGTWFWIDPKNDLFFLGMMQREGDDVMARFGVSLTLVYPALTKPEM